MFDVQNINVYQLTDTQGNNLIKLLRGADGQNGINGRNGIDGKDGANGADGVMSEAQSRDLQFIKDYLSLAHNVVFAAPSNPSILNKGCTAGVPAYFSANIIGHLAWDFGDGTTLTEQAPQHTFYEAGEYTVTLTATNVYGSTSAELVVTVASPIVITPTGGSAEVGVAYALMAQSQLALSNWLWDFGEGQTAQGDSASVTYDAEGTYIVSITANDDSGCTYSAKYLVSVGSAANLNDAPMTVDAAWVTDNGHHDERNGKAAFDSTNEGGLDCFHSNGQNPIEIRIDWPSPRSLTGFVLKQVPNGGYGGTWTVFGSNDNGETWETLALPLLLGGANDLQSRGIPAAAQLLYQSHLWRSETPGYVTVGEMVLYEAHTTDLP